MSDTERRCPVCNMKLFEGDGTITIKCRRCHSIIKLEFGALRVIDPMKHIRPKPSEIKKD